MGTPPLAHPVPEPHALPHGGARWGGAPAPQRPWEGAEGLEWEVPSPAPFHTFEQPPKLDATATRIVG